MTLHLTADLELNYARFVSRVKEAGVVWGLRSEDGWAVCPSNAQDSDVMPFWSARPLAARHAVEEWSRYVATTIPLDTFIDRWLRGMQQDGELVGVEFNADLAGLEVDPVDLARALVSDR